VTVAIYRDISVFFGHKPLSVVGIMFKHFWRWLCVYLKTFIPVSSHGWI